MISKRKTKEVLAFNKSIARKLSEQLPYSTTISSCPTGSVYLIVRFRHSHRFTSTKQLTIRIANHAQLSKWAKHDINLIVSNKQDNDDSIQNCITEILTEINLSKGIHDEQISSVPKE